MPDGNFKQAAYRYEIRIAGRIDPARLAWFDGMTLSMECSGEEVNTVILINVPDQSALFGTLARIRDLGIRLVSVNPHSEKND